MQHRGIFLAVTLALATGCVSGETRLLSQKEIVSPGEEEKNSVIDVKIEKYEKLAAEYPKEPKHRERLAAFYWQRENYQRALYNLDLARELDPNNGKYDYIEGRIHQDNGNYDLALVSYKRVIDSMEKDAFSGPHYDIAWLYLELKRVPEAVAELERCLEIEPVNPVPHYLLGKIELEQRGNKDAAIRHFEIYMELKGALYHEEVRNILINYSRSSAELATTRKTDSAPEGPSRLPTRVARMLSFFVPRALGNVAERVIRRSHISTMSFKTPQRLTTPRRPRHAISGPSHLDGPRRRAASHQEILLSTLRLNSLLPFSLFTMIEGEYLMYRKQDLPFTITQQHALRSSGVDRLYVSEHDLDAYWEYLRGNIRTTLLESSLSASERSAAFYDSTAALAQQIFSLPVTKEAFGTASVLVAESVKLQSEGKHMLHALMQQMKSAPSLYHRSLDNCLYGLALGHAFGMPRQDLESLGLGLFFMDIGMLNIPAQVIEKQSEFSGQERDQMRQHPMLGVTALSALPGVQEFTRNVIYGHHERIDGSGYPQGCYGKDVRLEARIAGLVDTFSALTSTRPHRPAYTTYEALSLMQKTLCSTFDLDLLRVLIRLLGR